MDSNKVLIGFFIGVVALLAAPVVVKQVRDLQDTATTTEAPMAVAEAAPPEKPALPPGTPAGYLDPPLLNEITIVNTSWLAQVEQYMLKYTFAPGGIVVVTHPMMKALTGLDMIQGSWYIQGDRVYLSFFMNGYKYEISLKIGGKNLYYLSSDGIIKQVQHAA